MTLAIPRATSLGRAKLIDLELERIRTDGGTQQRVGGLDEDVLEGYANAIMDGIELPPVVVFQDGEDYWLADGFYRTEAARRAGAKAITCHVHEGSRRDAVLFSCGANSSHGLRRTNRDKRRAIETLLRDDEWVEWSDNEIARRCGVDRSTVSTVRRDLESSCEIRKMDGPRTVSRNGSTYVQNTAKIGRPAPPPEVEVSSSTPEPDYSRTEAERTPQSAATGFEGEELGPGWDDDPDQPGDAPEPPLRSFGTEVQARVHPPVIVVEGDAEPSEEEKFLESIPVRRKLSARCREILDRDALAFRKAEKHLATIKHLGLTDARKTGVTQGWFQFRLMSFLLIGQPHSWLLCHLCNGQGCDSCRTRGYVLP
ncbi:ParB N-terminal domain-containing protein [Singulisphaera sp. PoT]|uniref:ParB N-terminal domain-containing protein n=1 Tax=Singulisphaera sp. PoT TaxID=3411797 RepID=UPI003BF4BC71